ncbi:bis(5'-nucleosyl)-tetraphosphatase (symmetrical) YqeK [Anaerovorax odorimutans]|uniref:bis(5'-nucleosyl)-tetraphosphatase (symmetrical) YqeK n=1 Tax=Anaerovorax odorimutans TaxID=109327 RepID=UPI0004001058|nr:bis(5'-nucleosyl)-tetraphosphatase (symmetrical) YqeK [Anaerovorax odorimutans]
MIPSCIYDYIENNMSEKRRIHTFAVAEEAKKLAKLYGEDVYKAELAALVHDFYRGINEDVLNAYVSEFNLDSYYLGNANLAHGKIAANIIKRDYNIEDQDIINAVSYHTTGRDGMSTLEKIIYIADAIEPNRSYPGIEELRELAYIDLDKACLMSLKHVADYVQSQELYLDLDTVRAIDFIKKELQERGK